MVAGVENPLWSIEELVERTSLQNEVGMETLMGFMIVYRKSPQHAVEYHYERKRHVASATSDAILLERYELLGIQSAGESEPLTIEQVFARRNAKADYCKAMDANPYQPEEIFAIERFRAAHPSN